MLSWILVVVVLNSFVFATENKPSLTKNNHGITPITKNNVASLHNISYIDKAENMLRTPNINKFYEEHKKKKPKKSPKSTIQKIIKKNRSKVLKTIYMQRMTMKPTPQQKVDNEKTYQEEKQWRDEITTHANQKKRPRKYSPKNSGYHIPFQKLHAQKRNKRGLSRELYILKDLDEIEFLSKEDGDNVVRAHTKNIWQI